MGLHSVTCTSTTSDPRIFVHKVLQRKSHSSVWREVGSLYHIQPVQNTLKILVVIRANILMKLEWLEEEGILREGARQLNGLIVRAVESNGQSRICLYTYLPIRDTLRKVIMIRNLFWHVHLDEATLTLKHYTLHLANTNGAK